MEWIYEMLTEIVFSVVGVICAFVAARLGEALASFWKERNRNECIERVAATCVSAVQMMYRDFGGEEKLSHAMKMASELLAEKGICLSEERIRVCLESALANFKGAFKEP